jgi:hypothetical protein
MTPLLLSQYKTTLILTHNSSHFIMPPLNPSYHSPHFSMRITHLILSYHSPHFIIPLPSFHHITPLISSYHSPRFIQYNSSPLMIRLSFITSLLQSSWPHHYALFKHQVSEWYSCQFTASSLT